MSVLKILSPEEVEALELDYFTKKANSWYETPEHSITYSNTRPDWVAIWYSDNKSLFGFCAFKVTGKVIYLSGPSVVADSMFKELLKRFGCRVLVNSYQKKGGAQSLYFNRKYCKSESDWVIDLPLTFDHYLKRLGKRSRTNLKKYYRRFDDALDSEFVVLDKLEITEDVLTRFFELHRMRMEKAGKSYVLPEEKIQRRIRHARNSGLFCGRWVNGELVAGTLNFSHGSTYYLSTVAHHPDYDKYHLGLLSVADATRYFISQNVKQYNLHVRYSPFKTRLGGKENSYYDKFIFLNSYAAVEWHLRQLENRIKRLIIKVLGLHKKR